MRKAYLDSNQTKTNLEFIKEMKNIDVTMSYIHGR